MYKIINIQFVCAKCPNGMNEKNCPVDKYINEESDLFHKSISENTINLAKSYNNNRVEYEWALANIAKLCEQCRQGIKR